MDLPQALDAVTKECSQAWGLSPAGPVAVHPCARLKTSLARCRPSSREICVNLQLSHESAAVIREVLIHELAHLMVFEKYGSAAKPHGPEWCEHVLALGLMPTVRLAISSAQRGARRKPPSSCVFQHRCPICQFTRYSKRPQRRWRCASCAATGLDGSLVIESVAPILKENL
jgi:predicted SprT family Zn-dependent metalloprotease